MDKIKKLQAQLAEMRKLNQHKTPSFQAKYRDLIAQVYKQLEKIYKRPPTLLEWKETAGVDVDPINRIRKTGNYPLGKNPETRAIGMAKKLKTMHAKPVTGIITTGADDVIGVKFRNIADKKKVKDILTEWFGIVKNSPEQVAYGGQAAVIKKLRTI